MIFSDVCVSLLLIDLYPLDNVTQDFVFLVLCDNFIQGCAVKYCENRIVKLLAQKKLLKWLQNICKTKCILNRSKNEARKHIFVSK